MVAIPFRFSHRSPHQILLGLDLARLADLPPDVLEEAEKVATWLADREEAEKAECEGTKTALRRRAMLRVLALSSLAFATD